MNLLDSVKQEGGELSRSEQIIIIHHHHHHLIIGDEQDGDEFPFCREDRGMLRGCPTHPLHRQDVVSHGYFG